MTLWNLLDGAKLGLKLWFGSPVLVCGATELTYTQIAHIFLVRV